MDPETIRRHVILALFSNPVLVQRFVLKGGNALSLLHGFRDRASLDIDISLDDDFVSVTDAKVHLQQSLMGEFIAEGFVVFDLTLKSVPPELTDDRKTWWGGYRLEFKIVSRSLHREFATNPETLRRRAQVVDGTQGRIIRVDISRGEWCDGKVERSLDGRTIYVYSEEMCVVEKFRALCQQIPGYSEEHQNRPSPRARDFFDIYTVVTRRGLDLKLPENLELFRLIFAAKRVPLTLMGEIRSTRDYHEPDWPAVVTLVSGPTGPFDRYFDFTVDLAESLLSQMDLPSQKPVG